MEQQRLRVGVVPFDYPPMYRRGEGPAAEKRGILKDSLQHLPVEVIDAAEELRRRRPQASGGVGTPEDLAVCIEILRARGADCLIVDLFHWTRVSLVVGLMRELDLPAALFANTRGGWNGVTAATAVGGSVREVSGSRNLRLLERFRDTDLEDLEVWLRGVGALLRLRRSRLLLWGGVYGADIPYTRSDSAALESALVAEVLYEQEMVLTERARELLAAEPQRISAFLQWLSREGASVRYDNRRLTEEVLRFQVALYLAARDRLAELQGESIVGVAVKCHFEMSTQLLGCTECLLPGFLPYGVDSEGGRAAIPVACEGDLPGLVSLALLHALNPETPPLFGDLAAYGQEFVLLRNCGASSVHWAGGLDRVQVVPNIHGKTGCAVHYETPATEEVTLARLFRAEGVSFMMHGVGRVAAPPEEPEFPDPWPHTRLRFDSDPYLFYQAAPCNHASVTAGNLAREIEVACRYAGISTVRCDRDESLRSYLHRVREGACL